MLRVFENFTPFLYGIFFIRFLGISGNFSSSICGLVHSGSWLFSYNNYYTYLYYIVFEYK